MGDIESVMGEAEAQWHIQFKRKSHNEASAACPFCRDGEDRFVIWAEGNYWCRQCGEKGWVDDTRRRLTALERDVAQLKAAERARARREAEQERQRTQRERMFLSQQHIEYHKLLDDTDRAWWHKQGINDESIDRYLLGVCYNCPTDRQHRGSYTIPVVNHGKLWNIRHRLMNADGGDKYRPHLAGLGNTLFNADNLYRGHSSILLVEGEKKSIVLDQYGFHSVGMMGMRAFPAPWAKRFEKLREVVVLLDPDAQDQAHKTAALFHGRGKVATLPVKCDDFFVEGGTVEEFKWFLKWARPVAS
jgi:DNA primase